MLGLTWFDILTLLFTAAAIVFVKLINATELLLKTDKATAIVANHINANPSTPTTPNNNNNKKLEKQWSDFIGDDKKLSYTQVNNIITPPNTPTGVTNNGNIPQTFDWANDASDEYHEDEDTISLENLFPCDQTEIYASKKIQFIIDELIQTETNYVNTLRTGIQNYGQLHQRADVPDTLKSVEKQKQLLNNIDEIRQLHERHVLPLMLRNQYDLQQLFEEFAKLVEQNHFYCYVVFSMNKKASMELRQEHREWLLNYQSVIKDKLGIDSFLVQPIQRLTRYPLLFQQFMAEYYKSHINCKPVLRSLCKLDARIGRVLTVVDQAQALPSIEELTAEVQLTQLGKFRQSTEFDVHNYRKGKKYRGKVFLFDRCLLCAELRKQRLTYRLHFLWDSIELHQSDHEKLVKIVSKPLAGSGKSSAKEPKLELELSMPSGTTVKKWQLLVAKIVQDVRRDAVEADSFPTEYGLCAVFAAWAIWQIFCSYYL